jgi:hypothetical protein
MWPRGGVTFVFYLASLFTNGAGKFISKNKIATMVVSPQTHDLCQKPISQGFQNRNSPLAH